MGGRKPSLPQPQRLLRQPPGAEQEGLALPSPCPASCLRPTPLFRGIEGVGVGHQSSTVCLDLNSSASGRGRSY